LTSELWEDCERRDLAGLFKQMDATR